MIQKGKGDKPSRSKTKAAQTQHALSGFGVPDKPSTAIGWDECSPEVVYAVVLAVTKLSGAVLFGRSRDGGALSLTVMLDDARKTVWFANEETLESELIEAITYFEALA